MSDLTETISAFPPLADSEPVVSVVIPAFNEEKNIGRCLDSLQTVDYPPSKLEIIIVDNGSTDATAAIARRRGATVLPLPGVRIAAMRNAGVKASHGQVIAFLDADCTAAPDWLAQGLRSLREEACITGSWIAIPEAATWLENAWFRFQPRGRHEAAHINTSNLFVTRAVFEALGGFDESLQTGEDTEFSARAKSLVKVIDDDRIRAVHWGNPKTLGQFVRREIWHGLGAFGSFRQDRFDKPLLGTFAFLTLTALQITGLALWALVDSSALFWLASLLLVLLLLATVGYRRAQIRSALHALQLAVLYYFFYLGRTISLYYLASGRSYYHGIK